MQELAIPAGENPAPFPWQATEFRTSLLFLSAFEVKLGIIMVAFVLIYFVVHYALLCGKKLANNLDCGEPMKNIVFGVVMTPTMKINCFF